MEIKIYEVSLELPTKQVVEIIKKIEYVPEETLIKLLAKVKEPELVGILLEKVRLQGLRISGKKLKKFFSTSKKLDKDIVAALRDYIHYVEKTWVLNEPERNLKEQLKKIK